MMSYGCCCLLLVVVVVVVFIFVFVFVAVVSFGVEEVLTEGGAPVIVVLLRLAGFTEAEAETVAGGIIPVLVEVVVILDL